MSIKYLNIEDLKSHTLRYHIKRLIHELACNENDYSVAIAAMNIYQLRQKIERESHRNGMAQIEYWVAHYEGK